MKLLGEYKSLLLPDDAHTSINVSEVFDLHSHFWIPVDHTDYSGHLPSDIPV